MMTFKKMIKEDEWQLIGLILIKEALQSDINIADVLDINDNRDFSSRRRHRSVRSRICTSFPYVTIHRWSPKCRSSSYLRRLITRIVPTSSNAFFLSIKSRQDRRSDSRTDIVKTDSKEDLNIKSIYRTKNCIRWLSGSRMLRTEICSLSLTTISSSRSLSNGRSSTISLTFSRRHVYRRRITGRNVYPVTVQQWSTESVFEASLSRFSSSEECREIKDVKDLLKLIKTFKTLVKMELLTLLVVSQSWDHVFDAYD